MINNQDRASVSSPTTCRCHSSWGVAATAPAIPVIPLDVLEELTAAGATLDVVMAACRAIGRMLSRMCAAGPATDATRDATDATLHATKPVAYATRPVARPKSSTERSRDFRAKKRDIHMQRDPVACNVAVASPPSLSLIENIDSKREREPDTQRDAVAHATKPVASPGLMPLPEDWQPTVQSRAKAVGRLGEVRAGILIDKFRNHYLARPHDMRTSRSWHSKFDNWTLSEHLHATTASLPLMTTAATGPPAVPGFFIKRDTPQWRAWTDHRGGKAPITGRSGDAWMPTEWPPDYVRKRESG